MMERVAIIIGISLQFGGLVWYVSTLDNNVETNAREIARHEISINKLEDTAQSQALMSARIDENIKAIRETLEKMAAE
tara:strand:- start:360 stop:593 length:234 start_codon:yes stop_codon:yes gene_type:complete